MKDVFLAAAPIERWQVYDVVKEMERTIAPSGPWQEWESSLTGVYNKSIEYDGSIPKFVWNGLH